MISIEQVNSIQYFEYLHQYQSYHLNFTTNIDCRIIILSTFFAYIDASALPYSFFLMIILNQQFIHCIFWWYNNFIEFGANAVISFVIFLKTVEALFWLLNILYYYNIFPFIIMMVLSQGSSIVIICPSGNLFFFVLEFILIIGTTPNKTKKQNKLAHTKSNNTKKTKHQFPGLHYSMLFQLMLMSNRNMSKYF